MRNNNLGQMLFIISLAGFLFSCKSYLETKPDKSLIIPRNVKDLSNLLNNGLMTAGYPNSGTVASDYYYVTYNTWNALSSVNQRNNYLWAAETQNDFDFDYLQCYQRIFSCNVILDEIRKLNPTESGYSETIGQALFFRAYNYYELAQIYAYPYNEDVLNGSNNKYGLSLHLTSDINELSIRSTVAETYARIIDDLNNAIDLLPSQTIYQALPTKAAGYALLARVYLNMSDYENALTFAEKAIHAHDILLDYNVLDSNSTTPFVKFNEEVIFQTSIQGTTILSGTRGIVDTTLYKSFDPDDLRKKLFFRRNPDGTYRFKGNYSGSSSSDFFNGLATDELYLIKAECSIRLNQIEQGITTLNKLLVTRWKQGRYIPIPLNISNPLDLVLRERRKELSFRAGIIWSDLRRLNTNDRYKRTIKRSLNGGEYQLIPGDLKYTFLFPTSVIAISGMEQNPR